MTILRADLHVHTLYSRENKDLPFLRSRDCYSEPEDVYRTAKRRGMDLVAITDHDTIDGCLAFLDRHPDAADFIVGEEVSCRMPDTGVEVHLGVYGIDETIHRDVQPLRGNVFDVCAYLREAGVFFALNHLLHFYRPALPLAQYLRLLFAVSALEVRNGAMLPAHNALVEHIAQASPDDWSMVAGSDAHTLRRVGTTWTEAPASTRDEFMEAIAAGRGRAGGGHGGTLSLAADVYGVVGRYVASLLGVGPQDHAPLERAGCLAFSLVSLPFQFTPLVVAALAKRREAGTIAHVADAIAPWIEAHVSSSRELSLEAVP